MKIVDRGTVFKGDEGSEWSSACFAGVCCLPSGRWLVGFRAAPKKANTLPQRVAFTWSDDQGKSWSAPVVPFGPKTVDGKTGGWRTGSSTALGGERVVAVVYWVDESDPALPFFNEETEGLLDSRPFLATSEDGGETWADPVMADTSPFNTPNAITGPLLLLPDGTWILQFETNKHYYDTSVWHHSSVFMFSRNQGLTWPEHVTVAADSEGRVFYWDQRPNVLANGTVLDLFWTFDRKEAVYLNIHGRDSKDGGRTWSDLWDTGVPGQPAPPVMLSDGRIVMPYVDREGPTRIKLRTSDDNGRTWPCDTEIDLYDNSSLAQQGKKGSMQDAWSEMGKFSVGLPRTALMPDDEVLVVYYA